MALTISELKDIALNLSERLKVDYTNFADGFFRRRIAYLFDKMSFHRTQDLYSALASLVKFDEIAYYLSVPQTELFRAPAFWRHIIKTLADPNVKSIWLPDLSSYHELYSLLITLDMAGRNDIRVVANLLSDKAKNAILSLNVNKKDEQQDISNFQRLETQASFDQYVLTTPDGSRQLRKGLVDTVEFRNGWFINTQNQKFDIIILRDTLLSYNLKLHQQAVAHLADSLSRPGALLCIGAGERPLGSQNRLAPDSSTEGVYSLIA
ncbi:MAG: hypothetical protein II375_08625 [Bacteroidales bacterium]|nr:hypothetical protein [Bacteroidales bacterium]